MRLRECWQKLKRPNSHDRSYFPRTDHPGFPCQIVAISAFDTIGRRRYSPALHADRSDGVQAFPDMEVRPTTELLPGRKKQAHAECSWGAARTCVIAVARAAPMLERWDTTRRLLCSRDAVCSLLTSRKKLEPYFAPRWNSAAPIFLKPAGPSKDWRWRSSITPMSSCSIWRSIRRRIPRLPQVLPARPTLSTHRSFCWGAPGAKGGVFRRGSL